MHPNRRKVLAYSVSALALFGILGYFNLIGGTLALSEKAKANVPEFNVAHLGVGEHELFAVPRMQADALVIRVSEEAYKSFFVWPAIHGPGYYVAPPYHECSAITVEEGLIRCKSDLHKELQWDFAGKPNQNWAPKLHMIKHKIHGEFLRLSPGA